MADPDQDHPEPPEVLVLSMGWFPDTPGGLTRYSTNLTLAQARRRGQGPATVVIGPAQGAPSWVEEASPVDSNLAVRMARFARVARRRARAASVVDSHFALYASGCLLVPAVRRLPLVVHFHGPWAEEFVANGAPRDWRIELKARLESWVYHQADALVVTSRAFARILTDDFAISADRITVLGAGVDLEAFCPGDRAEARRRLDLDDDDWVAVAPRRLVPRMGLDVALDAWARLGQPGPRLLVVGDGPSRPALAARAAELGLGERVRFLGLVGDEVLRDCYRAADVALVPSVALEGFGLVVLEALACGLPVVATDAGGPGEVLSGLDPTLVVPAGDAVALADRLDRARQGDLPGAEACRAFSEGHSWDALAQRHEELYARVAARRG